MQDFFNNINWMLILRCFIIGGLFCVVGQILIDKTKLTPARILVIYVTLRSSFTVELVFTNML